MMRRASNVAARTVVAGSVTSCNAAAAAPVVAPRRLFGSKYSDDLGNYKRPYTYESRSGAHRHPSRKEMLREQRAAAAAGNATNTTTIENTSEGAMMEGEDAPASVPRGNKSRYDDLFRKKADQRMSFTSNFREPDMKPILNASGDAPRSAMPEHRQSGQATKAAAAASSADVDDDTDVTRIYSKEEVHSMQRQEESGAGEVRKTAASDDVLEALSGTDDRPPTAAAEAVNEDEAGAAAADDEDEFAEIRSHPFFMDMLRRVERNMIRFRKETRAAGRYSLEAVNECVRPLLQLTDYPLTARQLSLLSHSISPAVLKSSLRDRDACAGLQLYRSQDTDLLLDWSKEDFLRRRYESVHMSWEPMDVICRRFGWTPEMLSPRDYLLYFSAFPEYVEMAELQTTGTGEPKAVPIEDPVARAAAAPIAASRLLLRRTASVDAEPSLTESIRLMGSPAVTTPAKGKKAQRMRQAESESVSDYFGAVEAAASTVDGDEVTRLQHAIDNVPPLRQASHPGGRTIREFSVPKKHAPPTAPRSSERRATPAADTADADDGEQHGGAAAFDQQKFEDVSNAYHNVKVENSLMRRRMQATDNVDKTQEMQAQLASGRREQQRLEQELERMRELKRTTVTTSGTGSSGFAVPRGQPQYPVAPEFTDGASKNESAVEDNDDAEIEQALQAFKEREAARMMERRQPHSSAAPAAAAAPSAAPTRAPTAATAAAEAEGEEEVEVAEEVVDNDDDDNNNGGNVVVAQEDRHRAVSAAAASHRTPAASSRSDQPWQDELAAAVEQQEAEMEEQEDDYAADLPDTPATNPAARLEQLASLHDRLSSAADRARRYVATVESRRQDVLEKLDRQLADANAKVGRLEERLGAVEEERAALRETLAREAAERKAREVEAQLQAQRERRMTGLAQQRERARVAQEEAAKALERQKKAEREALAMEEELQRKLREVQSKLRSLHETGSMAPQETGPAAEAREEEDSMEASAPAAAAEAPLSRTHAAAEQPAVAEEDAASSAATVSAGQFMCTPEQYDGLHLAAERLKKEIAALEAQMEEEGDEDDETLMAVLAESRADLEELEECIGSVQSNAPWAATRDAKREREHAQAAQVADTDARRLQSDVENQRFQISLLEKRLQHATQKAVTAKLNDRITQCRRAISQARVEQDRLRRTGRDSMGLPPSMSIAETLANEMKDEEAAKMEEEVRKAAAASPAAEAGEGEDDEAAAPSHSSAAEAQAPGAPAARSDAEKLRVRLDSMVKDIQHLQDSIEAQERTHDYDDEEKEVVLREMKDKLSQLLRLRDQVQRALVEESVNAPSTAGGPTPVIRPSATAAAPAPSVVGAAGVAAHGGSSAAQHGRPEHVPMASKKIRSSARTFHAHRRR